MSKFIRWTIYRILGAYHKVVPQVFAERINRRKYLEGTDKIKKTLRSKNYSRGHTYLLKRLYLKSNGSS